MKRKYKNLILSVESRLATELKKHRAGVGKRYIFSDNKNNPKGNIYAILRKVSNVKNPPKHIQKHKHNCDSLWMFVGDKENLTGLKVEIVLGDEIYQINTPFSVYIPKNLEHTYNFIEGSGSYINILIAKGGNYNSSTN
ncbi:MAG: hypothetical protein WC584_02660 [Candidatus Pacearchaeota archaeon]